MASARAAERELQRHRKRDPDVGDRRVVAAQRRAEIARQHLPDEVEILHRDRLIEPELVAQVGELRLGGALAEQQGRDIARQHMHGEEHDDADADQHQQELPKPAEDIPGHKNFGE